MLEQDDLKQIKKLITENNKTLVQEVMVGVGEVIAGQILPQIDGLTERVDGLTERVDGLTERVDGLTERVDGLSERVDRLQGSVNAMPDRDYLDMRVAGLKDDLAFKVRKSHEKSDAILELIEKHNLVPLAEIKRIREDFQVYPALQQ